MKVKHCACGWPASTLRPGEVAGTMPDRDDCPECGAPLVTTEIPDKAIVPRKFEADR